jgi:hypothetical protein
MFRSYDPLQAENTLLSENTQLTMDPLVGIIYFLPEDGRTTETRSSINSISIKILTYDSDVV